MIQLGKYEKYLIEEFFDDYRAGTMSQHTFTRRVAVITGSMTAAAAAMALVGCTPQELPRSTDPMPTPSASGSGTDSAAGLSAGAVPGPKSLLSVPEGAPGLVYPGVDHAFHNDTGDRYNEAQATAAWNDTLAWFGKCV
jgi:carboxymethylenebutenolidase